MRWLLDTNAVIALLNDPHGPLAARARRHPVADLFMSAIVLHELFYGAFRSSRPDRNATTIDGLPFAILPFDQDDAREAGAIRAALARQGTPIGPYDALIASQAKARGLVLVTRNTAEFARVRGLRIEDWQRTA